MLISIVLTIFFHFAAYNFSIAGFSAAKRPIFENNFENSWLVSIRRNSEHKSFGILIDEKIVLTSGDSKYWLDFDNLADIQVFNTEKRESIPILDVVKPLDLNVDLALILLARKPRGASKIRLPSEYSDFNPSSNNSKCAVIGWKKQVNKAAEKPMFLEANWEPANVCESVSAETLDQCEDDFWVAKNTCGSQRASMAFNRSTMFCGTIDSQSEKQGERQCLQNDGAPFICNVSGTWYNFGILSQFCRQTLGCKPADTCQQSGPTIFTDIARNTLWIQSTINVWKSIKSTIKSKIKTLKEGGTPLPVPILHLHGNLACKPYQDLRLPTLTMAGTSVETIRTEKSGETHESWVSFDKCCHFCMQIPECQGYNWKFTDGTCYLKSGKDLHTVKLKKDGRKQVVVHSGIMLHLRAGHEQLRQLDSPYPTWLVAIIGVIVGLIIGVAVLFGVCYYHKRYMHPFNSLDRISQKQISKEHKIGEGNFCEVWKGLLTVGDSKSERSVVVAIKVLKWSATDREMKQLLEEALILQKVQDQSNIVKFFGLCLDSRPNFLVLEYVNGGSLLQFLRKDENRNNLSYRKLVMMAKDVQNACHYLERVGYIHRDIAARNCLVKFGKGGEKASEASSNKNLVVKLADFGLAKDERAIYKTPDPDLPVAWVAPECFIKFPNKFSCSSIKSDVWSFGVLIWEIFSYGAEPYGRCSKPRENHACPCREMDHAEVQVHVCEARKTLLDIPATCTSQFTGLLMKIMKQCWRYEPKERPSFEDLGNFLMEVNRNIQAVEESELPKLDANQHAPLIIKVSNGSSGMSSPDYHGVPLGNKAPQSPRDLLGNVYLRSYENQAEASPGVNNPVRLDSTVIQATYSVKRAGRSPDVEDLETCQNPEESMRSMENSGPADVFNFEDRKK